MTVLAGDLRKQLEKAVVAARVASVRAAGAALTGLAVDADTPFASLSEADRALRVLLREKMRQLGSFDALVQAVAYEQWHTMLFARFLAENSLLMHPEHGVPVTLADCDELVAEEGAQYGAVDGWTLAARYAAAILPGIFRTDDPLLRVRYAAEGRQALEGLLAPLPAAVFTAEDSLGWVYQFWQTAQKAAVNASGRKIGGADISPVTQLFTEPYMVQFLLHNTLGAWWAARHPDSDLNATFTYLRVDEGGAPISGDYPGWPDTVAALRVLDPCCGSGHFLVAAFGMLRAMRMREGGLDAKAAGDAVLRDNLFGLELDPRCTQIAAFALALAAWTSGGYHVLPVPQVACSGIAVGDRMYNWTHIAGGNAALEANLRVLYETFQKAEDLGSLIDPARETVGPIFAASLTDILPRLERALTDASAGSDPATAVFGEAAAGAARAATLLAGKYHLVVTNPPFLGRGNQGEVLKHHLETRFPESKGDLATAFIERFRAYCTDKGTYASVTPQNWLFLGGYKKLRARLLTEQSWGLVARLGEGGFDSSAAAGAFVALVVLTNARPASNHLMAGLDAAAPRTPVAKAVLLHNGDVQTVAQAAQLRNPDARISLEEATRGDLLQKYAMGLQGICSGDYPRFGRCYWEMPKLLSGWAFQQSTIESVSHFYGMEHAFYWQDGHGEFYNFVRERLGETGVAAWIRGHEAWGKTGIAVSAMRGLPVSLYNGDLFDNNAHVIIPRNPTHLPAIWAFCSSPQFNIAVRRIDQALKVTNATLVKVPFDLEHWQQVADAQYPNGLPEPHSDDPTQWLFGGHPVGSTDPLQVAVARLLGYRWPEQADGDDGLNGHADADGIVCLPPVRGEASAAERLRALLAASYGDAWSEAVQEQLLADAGFGGKGLDAWLRDTKGFFAQHCARFHQRPFIWHLWDGRKDGFHALVNYHALDRQKLERLTYTYLGDWIDRQQAARDAGEAGADDRYVAALHLRERLELILAGEPPYDIHVRWKPLDKQPIGWEPDLNDGVRLNIRPFVEAGVLRGKVNVNWNKDRGTNPDGSERLNDLHHGRAEKEAARHAAGVTAGAAAAGVKA